VEDVPPYGAVSLQEEDNYQGRAILLLLGLKNLETKFEAIISSKLLLRTQDNMFM
jgi:hypothetical protein